MTCDLQLTTFSSKLLLSQCGLNSSYRAVESGEAYKIALVVIKGASPRGHMIKQHAYSLKTFALPLSLSSCSNCWQYLFSFFDVTAGHLRPCDRSVALNCT